MASAVDFLVLGPPGSGKTVLVRHLTGPPYTSNCHNRARGMPRAAREPPPGCGAAIK